MNVILLEDERASEFTKKLYSSYPETSIVKVSTKDTIEKLYFLNNKPLLTTNWLVLVDKRVGLPIIEFLATNKFCVNIIYATDLDSSLKLAFCKKLNDDSSIVDMLNISKDSAISFITSEISIDEVLAEKLYNKCNKFFPYIVGALHSLSMLDRKIVSKDLDVYVESHSSLTPNSLFYHLVGVKTLNYKSTIKYLYDYKNAFPYIKKKLLTLYNASEKLYKDIENGELHTNNLDDYCKSNKLKVSPYFVKIIVTKVYKTLTYDELILSKCLVNNLDSTLSLLSLF